MLHAHHTFDVSFVFVPNVTLECVWRRAKVESIPIERSIYVEHGTSRFTPLKIHIYKYPKCYYHYNTNPGSYSFLSWSCRDSGSSSSSSSESQKRTFASNDDMTINVRAFFVFRNVQSSSRPRS